MKKKVIIVDYQLGNLFSVKHALMNIGLNVKVSNLAADIENADALVLPGVGAFHDAMKNMNKHDLIVPIKDFIQVGKPFIGVCLGLQLLFTESEEFGSGRGLDIISGTVKKFPSSTSKGELMKVPHIAWNKIFQYPAGWNDSPLRDIQSGEFMYFVHSFYIIPQENLYNLSWTQYYDIKYPSSIKRNNIFACQFHPEKSANEGLKIYKTWAQMNGLL